MEFSIQSEELTKGLYRAQGIVEKKSAMPILSNVLFHARSSGKVAISATDLEVGMIGEHKAEVSKEGKITVSARHLYDIVRSLPKGVVKIKKLENNWAEIQSASVEYKMMGMSPEDFQNIPEINKGKLIKIDTKAFKRMIEKTGYAVSNDETWYNLNGAYLEKIGEKDFRMVATDGHRLSMYEDTIVQGSGKNPFSGGVIIPKKGLMELKRLLDAEDGDCEIGVDGNNLVFCMNTLTVVMRLLDGQFPEYRNVVPEKQKVNIMMDRKILMESLKRISILSSDRTLAVKITLTKGSMRVTTSNPDLGEAKEDIPIDYTGNDLTIGFNARYLIDALTSIEMEKIEFSLEDDLSPGVIKPFGDKKYTCVVMPMRI